MQSINTTLKRVGLLAGVVSLTLLPLSAGASAADTTAISQGFVVKGEVTTGALVSFADTAERNTVQAANSETVEKLVGVIGQKPLVELSDGTKQTQVVTNGAVLALVSDINGDIKSGDKITASPVSGIGMKAVESVQVVGTAQQDFSDAQQVSEQRAVNSEGVSQTIRVGLLPIQVNVAYYQAPEDELAFLPAFLQRFANAVAGRSVGPIRVLISLVLLLAGFGGVAVLLSSSVGSSIISIGRNPLSAQAVHRSLFEVGAIALGVLLVMLIAVYLVLVI
jgi:hypothetical protein